MTTARLCSAPAPDGSGPVTPLRPRATGGTVSSAAYGTWTDALGGTGTVFGTLDPQGSARRGAAVEVAGCLQVHVQDAAGAVTRTVEREVAAPLRSASVVTGTRAPAGEQDEAALTTLVLELGPLALDVPGLHLQLEGICLDVAGLPGAAPGEALLGALADLLDGVPAPLAALLDEVLAGQQRP
jgi:hypothetical protein